MGSIEGPAHPTELAPQCRRNTDTPAETDVSEKKQGEGQRGCGGRDPLVGGTAESLPTPPSRSRTLGSWGGGGSPDKQRSPASPLLSGAPPSTGTTLGPPTFPFFSAPSSCREAQSDQAPSPGKHCSQCPRLQPAFLGSPPVGPSWGGGPSPPGPAGGGSADAQLPGPLLPSGAEQPSPCELAVLPRLRDDAPCVFGGPSAQYDLLTVSVGPARHGAESQRVFTTQN